MLREKEWINPSCLDFLYNILYIARQNGLIHVFRFLLQKQQESSIFFPLRHRFVPSWLSSTARLSSRRNIRYCKRKYESSIKNNFKCVIHYIWMWLWIYLLLTSVIYILWYASGIKAVAVSKTTKGKKWQKVIQVYVLLESRHFWSCHDFWKAFKVSESVNSLLCVSVYMHCVAYIAPRLS